MTDTPILRRHREAACRALEVSAEHHAAWVEHGGAHYTIEGDSNAEAVARAIADAEAAERAACVAYIERLYVQLGTLGPRDMEALIDAFKSGEHREGEQT